MENSQSKHEDLHFRSFAFLEVTSIGHA